MLRIGLFASTLLLAACASTSDDTTSASGDRDCFRSEVVSGFNVIDPNTIEVRVSPSRRYRLSTDWPTSNLSYAEHLALRSATGQICTGNGLGVEIVGGEPVRHYPIQSITRAPEPAQG